MFDVAPTELLVLGTVALLVIPPKDLPKAMRMAGQWMSKARGVARQFRSGFDTMLRESELAEMEKRWAEENARIMREHAPEKMIGDMSATTAATPTTPAAPAETTADGEESPAPELVAQPTLTDAPAAAGEKPADR